ncbi:MAG TPA: DNA-directed RNA polymerase subunit F [Candidatus Aenigmarchaeota archaeon]|nr:DNA-directed RNA polymerase subunit F [Candidatus Aenigmarchaeota archaeon]
MQTRASRAYIIKRISNIMEVLKERLITNAEALKILEKREKKGELTYEQKKSLEILKKFSKISEDKAKKLAEELRKIEKLRERHIIAIVNLLPEDRDDLRVIMHKDYGLLDEEEKIQILETVKKFI